MDTREHLRVARESVWEAMSSGEAFSITAVSALDSAGLLCTRAEREFIEAGVRLPGMHSGGDGRWREAVRALMAERASAPATAPEPAVEPEARGTLCSPANAAFYQTRYAETLARIASLESALAEERAKPKEGARKYEVSEGRASWFVYRFVGHYSWLADGNDEFTGPDGERHAREHAAKLTAEQGGVA